MKTPRHILPAALITCAAALALPSLASAEDFCVNGAAGCTGTPVPTAQLREALKAADSNGTDDRFFLAPGTYDNTPLTYNSLEKVEIIGLSRAGTVLTSSDPGPVLTFGGNDQSKLSNLTVMPAGTATFGLRLAGTKADAVEVKPDSAATNVQAGVDLSAGARFSNGSVSLDKYGWGVVFEGSGGTFEDSSAESPEGIGVVGAGTDGHVSRSTVKAAFGVVVGTGHLAVSDTLINTRVTATPQLGVFASTKAGLNGNSATADLDRVTIIGSNQSDPLQGGGLAAQADGQGKTASVSLHDSVISGFPSSYLRDAQNGGTANVTTDRSVYLPNVTGAIDTGAGTVTETNHLTVSPHFVEPATGDFRLTADSQLIDAGTPGDLPAGALDHDGNARQSDGNGDCSHVSDIGAFEFQGTAVKAAAKAAVASASAGQAVAFSSDGSCIPGPGAAKVAWSFDDGSSAEGASVAHAFATPGKHTATATVSDGEGHSATASADVDVTAVPVPVAPPVISGLKVAPLKVRIGSVLPKLVTAKAASRSRNTIRFKVSRKARVDLSFAKVGKAGKARKVKTTVRVKAKPGANRVQFAGRLSRKARLTTGTYRLTAVATDTAGLRSKPRTARFSVVKAR
jgi:PKD repeat protein